MAVAIRLGLKVVQVVLLAIGFDSQPRLAAPRLIGL